MAVSMNWGFFLRVSLYLDPSMLELSFYELGVL